MVRKANGKKRMKLEPTAPGLPVFRAIAYGKPVNTRPQSPAITMKATTPRSPVSKRTPVARPRAITGTHRPHTMAKSATIRPRSSESRRTGVSSRRSKYPSWMSVTSTMAREMPVTAKMMATGSWKAL